MPESPSTPGSVPIEITEEEVMTEIVTKEYVENQVNENIEGVYEYLHGETEEIALVFDTEPVKENFETVLAEELETITLADIGFEELAQWKASEEAYTEGVQDRRDALRTQIQQETEEELSEEEIDAIMEDREDEFREEIVTQFMNSVPEDELPPGGEEGVRTMGNTIADAVLSEQSHDEFVSEINGAEETLRSAIQDEIMTRVDNEVPDQVDLAEQASQEDLEPLRTACQVVSVVSLLRLVLPIVSIGLIGGIVWVAPRYSSAAFEIGAIALSIGLGGVIAAIILPAEMQRVVSSQGMPQGLADFIFAVISNMSDVVMQQSAILLGAGVLVVIAGIVIRYRLLFEDFLDDKAID